jgi:hypothetical protein
MICMIVHIRLSVGTVYRGRLIICTTEQMILCSGRMRSGSGDLSWDSAKMSSQRLPTCPPALSIPLNKASQRSVWTKYSPCWASWVWTLC